LVGTPLSREPFLFQSQKALPELRPLAALGQTGDGPTATRVSLVAAGLVQPGFDPLALAFNPKDHLVQDLLNDALAVGVRRCRCLPPCRQSSNQPADGLLLNRCSPLWLVLKAAFVFLL
jgi:hypothetical protein